MADPTLHQRLLAELDHARRARGRDEMVAALRAVVELHAPVSCYRPCSLRHSHVTCAPCKGPGIVSLQHWPCSTIQVIADTLGLTEGERS